jgi:membrane protein
MRLMDIKIFKSIVLIAKNVFRYLNRLREKTFKDATFILASSVAYYFLFSIFPLMLILIALSAYIIDFMALKFTILDFVSEQIPFVYDLTESNIERIISQRASIGAVGFLFLILASTYVFDSIQYAINKIYRIKMQRRFWFQKLYGFLIMILIFLLIFLSFGLSAFIYHFLDRIYLQLSLDRSLYRNFLRTASILIGVLFNFGIFSIIYYFGTNAKIHFKNIYKGAIVSACLWEMAKHIFLFYLNNFANYELLYGSVGSIIAFLFWSFISAFIFLLGAQINSLDKKIK